MRKTIGIEAIKGRVQKMLDIREGYLKDIENVHIKIQKGNSKTGNNCWTVSLIPVTDCPNCSECMKDCYDIKNVCYLPSVMKDRARNSALHKVDRKRFWNEVDLQVKANFVTELRLNVGGDLSNEDFAYVADLGKKNPRCMILFFTKNYKGINNFLANNSFPANVKYLLSAWEGMELDNPFNLPCSHVLWEDGRTTAPGFGAIYCGGNCSECAFHGKGCWVLGKGEHVIFKAH